MEAGFFGCFFDFLCFFEVIPAAEESPLLDIVELDEAEPLEGIADLVPEVFVEAAWLASALRVRPSIMAIVSVDNNFLI